MSWDIFGRRLNVTFPAPAVAERKVFASFAGRLQESRLEESLGRTNVNHSMWQRGGVRCRSSTSSMIILALWQPCRRKPECFFRASIPIGCIVHVSESRCYLALSLVSAHKFARSGCVVHMYVPGRDNSCRRTQVTGSGWLTCEKHLSCFGDPSGNETSSAISLFVFINTTGEVSLSLSSLSLLTLKMILQRWHPESLLDRSDLTSPWRMISLSRRGSMLSQSDWQLEQIIVAYGSVRPPAVQAGCGLRLPRATAFPSPIRDLPENLWCPGQPLSKGLATPNSHINATKTLAAFHQRYKTSAANPPQGHKTAMAEPAPQEMPQPDPEESSQPDSQELPLPDLQELS